MKRAFPSGIFGALACWAFPKRIKTNAPINPMAIPLPLSHVIRSFRNKAESISNITGVSVMTTLLLMGVERDSPLKT